MFTFSAGGDYASTGINSPSTFVSANKTYAINFTVTGTGKAQVMCSNSASFYRSAGTHTVVMLADAAASFLVQGGGGGDNFVGTVTINSVKEADHGANVDGVKYFTTKNGNTVSSNIVTEVVGTQIKASYSGSIYGDSMANDSGDICGSINGKIDASFSITRRAVGGLKTSGIRELFDTHFSESDDYTIIEGGINNIISAASDPTAEMQLDVAAMMDEAIASGQKVILINVGPWKNHANWTTTRQSYTDTYNAWCASEYGNYLIDIYAELEDPSNADELLPAYDSGDGLHPNSTGYGVIDDAIIEAKYSDAYYCDSDGPVGALVEGQRQNICTVVSVDPSSTTGITKSGDAASVITVADDTAEIELAGLIGVNASGMVYKLDNSAGVGAAYAIVNGSPASTSPHAYTLFARFTGPSNSGRFGWGLNTSKTFMDEGGYQRYTALADPAVSGSNGRLTVTASAGAIVYFLLFQVEEGSYATSAIPLTSAAAVTRNADVYNYPITNNLPTNNVQIQLEWTPLQESMGTVYLWGSYVDANNSTSILHDGTNIIFRKRISGTNYDSTKALTYTAGTTYTVKATASDSAGIMIAVGGVDGTGHANTTAMQLGPAFGVGTNGNGGGQASSAIRNLEHRTL